MPRLLIVSNRVAVPDRTGAVAAGGLAVALREAFREYEGLWFGWSGKVAARTGFAAQDHKQRADPICPDGPDRLDRREYYNGFANRALWPTMHYRVGLSEFSRTDYAGYRRVNHNFATALARLSRPDDLVWVHDYHLIPLAAGVTRPRDCATRLAISTTSPGRLPRSSGLCPARQSCCAPSLLRSGGVQTERDADNLRRSLLEEFGACSGWLRRSGGGGGDASRVKSFPIGIDVREIAAARGRRASSNRLVQPDECWPWHSQTSHRSRPA